MDGCSRMNMLMKGKMLQVHHPFHMDLDQLFEKYMVREMRSLKILCQNTSQDVMEIKKKLDMNESDEENDRSEEEEESDEEESSANESDNEMLISSKKRNKQKKRM
ncbi:hypothetical protein V8G54_021769 [Vigna mungo]|uniref:Uncharacterized protein n=1 Tax=Vigna mungo TaxID=3915 RepID=A0AAQ3NHZ2_VIGMU